MPQHRQPPFRPTAALPVIGGLRPDSDIDVLLVTELLADRQEPERAGLASVLGGNLGKVSDHWSLRTVDAQPAADRLAEVTSGPAGTRWIVPEP